MTPRPSILCPIDFSDASAGALRYAAAIAEHFVTRLTLLVVEDPLLTAALDLGTGVVWSPEESRKQLESFAASTFGPEAPLLTKLEYAVAVGKPAPEILRVAREQACDLIVISTHGLTGVRKLFFGSTTERVLRETLVPVLVTPPHNPGPVRVEDASRLIRRILVPVDLSAASRHQTQVARGVAEALGVPLLLVHVIEPVRSWIATRVPMAGIEADRRAMADEGLSDLRATVTPAQTPHEEALVVYGDPAEEIAKVALDRQVGLVVMGLHGSHLLGPRMGSVTYRLLCLAPTLVLALPPKLVEAARAEAPALEVVAEGQVR